MHHAQTDLCGVVTSKHPSPGGCTTLPNDEGPGHDAKISNPPRGNRNFFLGNTLLACGGASTPGYNPGIAYFCKICGDIWGRVTLGTGGWHSVSIPCAAHGGGSYLLPLIWWDFTNGRDPATQLRTLPEKVLRHEVKIRLLKSWNGGSLI